MTNDTNTLNGALRELGETMAANLTTQGVASTWDEGLTTLAGKILDITPGPGPTPSFDGISLTGNKNILSAADSEYVTLEAQLTDSGSAAAVSGETVTFTVYKSSDDSVVTTLTDDTDSSGLATVSYYGQGTGDIYIEAECTFVSETYSVVDADYYNPTGVTFTSNSSTDRKEASGLESYSYNVPSKFEVSYDYTITTGSNLRWYFESTSQSSNNYGLGFQKNTNNNQGVFTVRTTSSSNTNGGTIALNQTVNIRIVRDGDSVQFYLDNTLITTKTVTWIDTYKPYTFGWGVWGTGTAKIENIIVKPL